MNIEVTFPGGKKVDANVGGLVVHTDQPVGDGGDGTAVSPFALFMASLATCAGYFALAFCQSRGIDSAGMKLTQIAVYDPATHLPSSVKISLHLPPNFPEKYRDAVVRAAEACKVNKSIAAGLKVSVSAA